MPVKTSLKNLPCHPFLRYALASAMVAGVLLCGSQIVLASNTSTQLGSPLRTQQSSVIQSTPKIQLAILIDTSGSMDGLIDQTRNQLWQVVNEFSTARQNGITPILEIALFEYGNDSNAEASGYVKMINEFTRELDQVSEGLFSLTTNGGSEYCGYAIKTAIENLQWSQSNKDIKAIFIAGNEAFTQGPVNYQTAIELANEKDISINTIHAGGHQEGINSGWQSGALLADGDYMSIDSNQQVVHVAAPQDAKIAELNLKLNETYVPYGRKGVNNYQRQMEQDQISSEISASLLAKRAKSKSSSFYSNAKWDLVDAFINDEVNEEELKKIDEKTLPESMVGLSSQEKMDYVQGKAKQREEIKQAIVEQSQLRAAHIAKVKSTQVAASPSMGDALSSAIKKQAERKSFVFE